MMYNWIYSYLWINKFQMPLISGLNFFHVHNPRCGGTSLNMAFFHSGLTSLSTLDYKQCDMTNFYGIYRPVVHKIPGESKKLELDHLSISQVLSRLDIKQIYSLHFLSTIRHPWERFVSEYKRKVQRGDQRFLPVGDSSITTYLENFLCRVKGSSDSFLNQFQSSHFWPQHLFADFAAHADIKSFSVLRLENLDADWGDLQSKWNFKAPFKRRYSNATLDGGSRSDDAEIRDLKSSSLYREFQDFYRLDYDLFGYE